MYDGAPDFPVVPLLEAAKSAIYSARSSDVEKGVSIHLPH
jgi:hypothetical protein